MYWNKIVLKEMNAFYLSKQMTSIQTLVFLATLFVNEMLNIKIQVEYTLSLGTLLLVNSKSSFDRRSHIRSLSIY